MTDKPRSRRQQPHPPTCDGRLAGLAGRQDGVVSTAQLHALGLDDPAIHRRAREGRLHRLHRGAYAVGHRTLGPHGWEHAALLALGPSAVLSHRSAAAFWGIRPLTAGWVEVTHPVKRRSRDGILIHWTRGFAPGDVVLRHGVQVTSPARTLIDLADVLSTSTVQRALAVAERAGLIDRATFVLPPGRRRVVHGEHLFTRSGEERRLLALLRGWGLDPLVNQQIGRWEADFYWPAAGVVLELDLYETHGDRTAFERDREKDADLVERGLTVMRVTPRQYRTRPGDVRRRLERLVLGSGG